MPALRYEPRLYTTSGTEERRHARADRWGCVHRDLADWRVRRSRAVLSQLSGWFYFLGGHNTRQSRAADVAASDRRRLGISDSARVGSCYADTAANPDSLHSDHPRVEIDLPVDQFRVDEFGGIAEGESELPKSGLLHHSGRDLLCVLV